MPKPVAAPGELVEAGGTGIGETIQGGTLEIAAAGSISGAVTFASGAGGHLQIDGLQFSGLVAGFGGSDEIDFRGLAFRAGHMTVKFKEAANHQSGTLTIADGKETVALMLLGQYFAGNFHIAKDAADGTLITDPPVSTSAGLPANALVPPNQG